MEVVKTRLLREAWAMRVLAIGAHPDDVELGCGATLLRHVERGDEVTILVMTSGGRGTLEGMDRRTEQEESTRRIGAQLLWGGFEDGFVPDGAPSVEVIDQAVDVSGAEVMYTHAPNDTHQDHRATATASLASGRRLHTILHYETPTTQRFEPTVYVDVTDVFDGKLASLRAHLSQVLRGGPVDLESIEAEARFRGSQGRVHLAEAFEATRLAWDLAATPTLAPVVPLSAAS